jgi:CRISPR-associated protein Cmr3
MESDLGAVQFPVPLDQVQASGQLKEPTGLWVTAEGYSRILRGAFPDPETLFRSSNLWRIEPRVGLARDHVTRAAEEGKLYSPGYVRLRQNVKLAVAVEGIPDDWALPELTPFGGESRLAYCESHQTPLPLPVAPADQIRDSQRFTVSLLSPLFLSTNGTGRCSHPEPGEVLHSLAGSRIISACVGKPIRIGGWNSVHREPEPLCAYLPFGSTWFCEVARADLLDSILEMHGKTIGDRKPHGLGQIAIGAWPTNTGDTT